jgi:hypothetical protein
MTESVGPWNASDACPHVVQQPEWSKILGAHEHGDACETCMPLSHVHGDNERCTCMPSLMFCTGCPTVDDCRQARLCAQPWNLVRATPAETESWLEGR